MVNSKLIATLRSLNGHDLNRLQRFIHSPYFNQSAAISKLFDLVKLNLRKDEPLFITKEEIWAECFDGSKYDDSRFRKLLSDLLSLIEDFLSQQSFESNPIHKAKYLLDEIYKRNVNALQTSSLRNAKILAEQQSIKSASYYYFQYEIEQSSYYLLHGHVERSSKSNIEDIAENLDRFYLAEKLRYYCTILNHQHLADLNYKMLFIEEIIEHVRSNNYEDTPPIIMYYQILLSYKEPDNEGHFKKIKELIQSYIHLFPDNEIAEIIDSALNYCIKKMNAGDTYYLQEAFSLYRDWLEKDLLKVRGNINPFHFKNIVTIGLRLNEFDWIEGFIHQYGPMLDEKSRDNAITFNLAQLYFYKKDYPKVIGLLSKVEYDDMTYNLNSKTLLMASYYELDEIEALGSLLDTFRVYLSRNKELPATRRKHYLNTITIVRKLSRIAHGDMAAIAKLQKDVENTQGVVSKNWILEKLAHLQSSLV